MSAQRVVDIDLNGGVGTQLDHLTDAAEQEAGRHQNPQLQTGPGDLDGGGNRQRAVGGGVAAPAAHRRRRDQIRQKRSGPGCGDEQQGAAQRGDRGGLPVAH